MIDTRVILVAGGRGTRSDNPKLPKILQMLDPNCSILFHHLANIVQWGIKRVSISVGHGAQEVIQATLDLKIFFPQLEVEFVLDGDDSRGTCDALRQVTANVQEEFLIVIYGDVVVKAPLDEYLKDFIQTDDLALIVAHPNLHPEDSDSIIYSDSNLVLGIEKKGKTRRLNTPFRSPCGVFLMRREALVHINDATIDFSEALCTKISQEIPVRVRISSHYFKDSGTPTRLKEVRKDWTSGITHKRGSREKRPGLFVDRDGTLVPNIGSGRVHVNPEEVSKILATIIKQANLKAIPVFVVTNQPGIAKGEINTSDVLRVQSIIEETLLREDAFVDDFRWCPHHPEKGFPGEVASLKLLCDCRKPAPGMVLDLCKLHGIDLKKSMFIGDSQVDLELSKNLNMTFCLFDIESQEAGKKTEEKFLNSFWDR
jgi:mannose-1-phosphate guanylyltransferase/phosphomannomutase